MELFFGLYSLGLMVVIGVGFILLLRHISYAYIDTCSLFVQAESMLGHASIEKNFVEIYPVEENLSFQPRQRFLVNNLFLNILRWFPAERRLEAGQLVNLLLYAAFFSLLQLVFVQLGAGFGLQGFQLGLLSLTGALLICARTRLMLVAAMVLADCLNYLLFALTLLLAVAMADGAGHGQVALFGLLIGLAFRNKTQELFLFLAGVLYLLTVMQSYWQLPLFLLTFLLVNLEWLYAELSPGEGSYKTLYAYLGLFGPFFSRWKNSSQPQAESIWQETLAQKVTRIGDRLVTLYRGQGIWHSQGAVLLLVPICLVYLISQGELRGAVLFCLFYAGLTCLGLALMTHRYATEASGEIQEGCYLCGRQAYLAFPPLMVIVVAALLLAVKQSNFWLLIPLFGYLLGYFFHQLGRVLDYHFSDVIHESHFVELRKQPEPWSLELGEFLCNLQQAPAVILGDHLMYGKAYDFYHWSRELRCVDVHTWLSDEELLRYIDQLGVTHVVVTPFSVLRHAVSSLGQESLRGELSRRLEKLPTRSSSLHLYRVVNREEIDG